VSAPVQRVLRAIPATEVPVAGGGFFPVRRVYCVGRNYVDHIREMKEADERDPPFFFQKPLIWSVPTELSRHARRGPIRPIDCRPYRRAARASLNDSAHRTRLFADCGGARMAVWVIVNVEEWDILSHDAAHRADAAGRRRADARHSELGLARIRQPRRLLAHAQGVRRVQDPGVLAINGSAIAAYPPIVAAAMERKWEFIGHGFTQRNMQKVEDERADIRKTREAIAKATGKPPRGWLGPA
jgi:hypothetical protein